MNENLLAYHEEIKEDVDVENVEKLGQKEEVRMILHVFFPSIWC